MAFSNGNSGDDSAAFDRVIGPVLQILTVEQARKMAQFRGDESLRKRIDELADKSGAGQLSAAEQSEYDAYVRANELLAILQARIQRRLVEESDLADQISCALPSLAEIEATTTTQCDEWRDDKSWLDDATS